MPADATDWPYSQQPWVNREGPFPAPTAAELAAFEQRHAIALPAAYRDFLMMFVGGPPEGCSFWVPGLDEYRAIIELYPLTTRSDGADLEGCIDWEEFIPTELLAFADDGYGSWSCLGIRGAATGQVFYVCHDLQIDDPRRINCVAASFEAFMQKLRLPDSHSEGQDEAGPRA